MAPQPRYQQEKFIMIAKTSITVTLSPLPYLDGASISVEIYLDTHLFIGLPLLFISVYPSCMLSILPLEHTIVYVTTRQTKAVRNYREHFTA